MLNSSLRMLIDRPLNWSSEALNTPDNIQPNSVGLMVLFHSSNVAMLEATKSNVIVLWSGQ